MEIKSEIKPKKSKLKPKKKALVLSDLSDEESMDNQKTNTFTKRQNELKIRFEETRLNALQSCHLQNESVVDEVFDDQHFRENMKHSKGVTNPQLQEVIGLMVELKSNRNNIKEDSIIVDSDSDSNLLLSTNETKSVSQNTRSKQRQTKKSKKGKPKKGNPRKSGRKSHSFDERKAFEKLDGMEAMDDIEVFEDLNTSSVLNVSQEIDEIIKERDIELKIKYKAVVEKITMKSTEKFTKIMPLIAQKFNENLSELVFELNDQIIDSESTPQQIGITISDFIVCHKRSNKNINSDLKDSNFISIKLKDKTMKNAETLNINKFSKIEDIINSFSKFKKIGPDTFHLNFDGEKLESQKTIAECDIEDECQIDIILL